MFMLPIFQCSLSKTTNVKIIPSDIRLLARQLNIFAVSTRYLSYL